MSAPHRLAAVLRLVVAVALAACVFPAAAQGAPPATDAGKDVGITAVPPPRTPATTLDAVRRRGVLRVGVVSIPPWTMPSKSGELIGFEIDVGRQLAADLGVRPEFVRTSLASYAGDLASGFFDVAAAGVWPDPTSALIVGYSDPYALNVVDLIVNVQRSRAAGIDAYDRAGVSIGARKGSHSQALAGRQFPRAQLQVFDDDAAMFTALVDGRLTAIVAASPVGELLTSTYPKRLARPLAEPLAARREAFAVARGDADLLAYLNAWILYRQDTGWLKERRDYWFRSLRWAPQL